MWSFLEAVSRFVICNLMQLVVRIKLRFAATVVDVRLLLPEILLQHRKPQRPIPSQCQQPEFQRWLPPRVATIAGHI